MQPSLGTHIKLDIGYDIDLPTYQNETTTSLPLPDHPTVPIPLSTRQWVPAILHHTISALASGVGPAGTCVNIEVILERLIHTLNDIRFRKCGGLFGVDGVAGRS